MALDNEVGIESLRGERSRWQNRGALSCVIGVGYMGLGAASAAVPLSIELNHIAKNIAFSATGVIQIENVYKFAHPSNLIDIAGFAFGGLFFGIGIYKLIRAANATHKADELADRIREIEQSQQYKAKRT